MAVINFNAEKAYELNDKSFFVLGSVKSDEMNQNETKLLEEKLKNGNSQGISGVWGTLGWEDNEIPSFSGKIEFTDDGNFHSKGATLKVVNDIYSINPFGDGKENLVRERFINFDDMEVGRLIDFNRSNEMPYLRLTVFLDADEGAIAYLQHSTINNYDEENAPLEFVMPEKGADDYSVERDRITFLIPLDQLRTRSERFDILGKTRISSFIVKVLTYKRAANTAEILIQEAKDTLHANSKDLSYKDDIGDYLFGAKKYAILNYIKYDNHEKMEIGGIFKSIDEEPIDFSKKTLLLIHGTFASVSGTFSNLYNVSYNRRFLLNNLIDEGVFEQIIAFNHPTVSENAQDNVEWFLKKIAGNVFTQPVSIVSASRGALVSKRFADKSNDNIIPIDKVIMFSGANGVGWFKVGKQIARGLSILKSLSTPGSGKIILAFLQFSSDFFLKQKACIEMSPDSKELEDLLSLKPQSKAKFLNIVSDWDSSLVDGNVARTLAGVLDFAIKGALGNEHDWVVGTNNQRKYFLHNEANTEEPLKIVSMHCMYFNLNFTHANTHDLIKTYFQKPNIQPGFQA